MKDAIPYFLGHGFCMLAMIYLEATGAPVGRIFIAGAFGICFLISAYEEMRGKS
jgi:hypothetical protein